MGRRKTMRAGRLVHNIAYTVFRTKASAAERRRIRETRLDDKITRGEVFALRDQVVESCLCSSTKMVRSVKLL